jgi:tRNA(Ile)-lysidine synthase
MAEFGGHFSTLDLTGHIHIAAAVSGGSDSTGLLVFLQEYLKEQKTPVRLSAVTVDHGLRAGSASEAKAVSRVCARLGVPHAIKRWEGGKPASGIQAAAREARYDLIAQAARETGASLVLTGHTEDDQLETVFMRARRGEGPGLAGMAPATLAFNDHDGGPPLWFARPLLKARRLDIRGALMKRAVKWSDDPSNANVDFERVAVRQELARAGAGVLNELRVRQSHWARARTALSQRIARIIDAHASEASPGLLLISEEIALDRDHEAAAEALRICFALAGGSVRMIEFERAQGLLSLLARGEPFRMTASRALLDRRKQGLFVLREKRGVPEADDVTGSFDNRFVIPELFRAEPYRTRFTFLDERDLSAADAREVPESLRRQAFALWPQTVGREVDRHVDGRPVTGAARRLLNPWPLRLPLFDLAAASALARLTRADPFPPPPLFTLTA